METQKAEFAHIGKSVIIKGELSGSEDLYVDGVVEGIIQMQNNNLIIGPNGQVRAGVQAKGVTVKGKLEGNIRASERTELRKSAVVVGDISTHRIAIEEGAYFKGKVDVQKEPSLSAVSPLKVEPRAEAKSSVAPATAAPSSTGVAAPVASGTVVTK
jgi:cytoskeletal protein CcmA (bactofilin family)